MYENNLITQYITSDRKVKDWNKLTEDSNGLVFVRAAFIPYTKWTDGVQSGNYFIADATKTDDDYLREDPDYKTNFLNARSHNLKVVSVIEVNSSYDRESGFDTKYQYDQIRKILSGIGDYVGDALCLQVLMYQWIESNKIKTIPDANFRKMTSILMQDLYNKYRKTVFLWSQSKVIKAYFKLPDAQGNTIVYNYIEAFSTFLDNANRGEATWPVGFTYLPASWRSGSMVSTVDNLKAAIPLFPALTSSEVGSELRIGSYQGWLTSNQAGSMPNYSFWGLFGPKLSYLATSTGAIAFSEPIVFDTNHDNFFNWMGWKVETNPDDPGDDGDTGDGDGTGDPVDLKDYLKIADFEAYKSLTKVVIDQLVADVADLKKNYIQKTIDEIEKRLED